MEEELKKFMCEVMRLSIPEIAEAVAEKLTPKQSENFLQKDACKRLNVTQPTLRKLIAEKEIRTVTIGTKVMIPSSEVDRLLEGGNYKYNRK